MGTRVASIFAEIGIDAGKFTSGSQGILGGLDALSGGFASTALKAATFAGALTLIAGEMRAAHDAAMEGAKAQAKLESSLKSTGHAAGLTVEDLNKSAKAMSRLTGVDDEAITAAQGMLLTFRQLKGEVFNQAMQYAIDMQAKGFGNLEGNVVMLGKAMSNFDGYTALQRQGVKFTPTQLQQMENFKKSNDLIGYQKVILSELKGEFEGTAKAINDASDGSADLNNEWGNLQENIGNLDKDAIRGLIVSLTDLLRAINDNWEAVRALYNGIQDLHRAIVAVSSLGLSEIIRWWMARGGTTPPVPSSQPAPPKTHAAGGETITIGHAGGGGWGMEELIHQSFIENRRLGNFIERTVQMNYTENRRLGSFVEKSINMNYTENQRLGQLLEQQKPDDNKRVVIHALHVGNGPNVMTREQAQRMIQDAFKHALRRQ
jgi:hypothetical protein